MIRFSQDQTLIGLRDEIEKLTGVDRSDFREARIVRSGRISLSLQTRFRDPITGNGFALITAFVSKSVARNVFASFGIFISGRALRGCDS